jgi:glycosyltransferase involved in cell wall biosynthesis
MITVLMSTYNGEMYLKEQLDSILNQEQVDLTLLIRDDGSTDGTVNILKEYENLHGNIKWYSGTNLGCGKSFFQLVLDAPESDYYAFADQDDVWDKDKLAIAISNIKGNSEGIPSLYCSAIRPVDSNLKLLPHKKARGIEPTFGIALAQAIAPGCSYVFNKSLLDKFKKMKIDDIDIHDWALFRVVTALDGYVYYDVEPHFSYRQHGNNVIGYQGSMFQHWVKRINRFKNNRHKQVRLKMAKNLKYVLYEEMSEKNKKIIDRFTDYEKGFIYKSKLIQSKDIKMLGLIDNFIFKILVLYNWI